MSAMDLFKIFISAALVDNIILARYIGLCPYIGMSSNVANSWDGDGSYLCHGFSFYSYLGFVELYFCASGVGISPDYGVYSGNCCFSAITEAILKKTVPNLYQAMGIYLPLITTNCAILALPFGVDYNYNLLQVVVYSIGVALGFTIALLLLLESGKN